MYEAIGFKIKGVSSTILHNGQTSDPLNEYSKKLKALTSKKRKSDQDHLDIAELEWYAALYVDEQNRPCWPGENIEAMIVSAAKKNRMGQQVRANLFVDGNSPIIHDGPRTADAIWKFKALDKNPYISRVPVFVNQSRVMRTRPIFPDWSLEFIVHYKPSVLNLENVVEFVTIAGRDIGLSDWRPKYGRFEIEEHHKVKQEIPETENT
jgi:hypothetical protein